MKIKMKQDVVGVKGDGGESMLYEKGKEYSMNSAATMAVGTAWMSDGRAEQADTKKLTKVVNEMEKKVKKSVFGKILKKSKKK